MQNKVIKVASAVVNIIKLPSFLFHVWLESVVSILENANARARDILMHDN